MSIFTAIPIETKIHIMQNDPVIVHCPICEKDGLLIKSRNDVEVTLHKEHESTSHVHYYDDDGNSYIKKRKKPIYYI